MLSFSSDPEKTTKRFRITFIDVGHPKALGVGPSAC
jgi:hypothetical protein